MSDSMSIPYFRGKSKHSLRFRHSRERKGFFLQYGKSRGKMKKMCPKEDDAMRLLSFPRRLLCLLLVLLLLTGCASTSSVPEETTLPTETTEPAPTAPPDGNPDDVTCKGSYTGTVDSAAVVATAGEYTLTAGVLQVLYGLELRLWQTGEQTENPDWSLPLDVQLCPMEGTAVTWQQFFLERALNTWHTLQALVLESTTAQMELDPEYVFNQENFDKYWQLEMPALEVLYGYDPSYEVNSMHQDYIDSLPDLLETLGGADALAEELGATGADLLALAELANYAYAYFTFAHDYLGITEEEITALAGENTGVTGSSVTFRHILLLPEGDTEEAWAAAESQGNTLLTVDFAKSRRRNEGNFAVIARENSQDEGTRNNGGLYSGVTPGIMPQALDTWLFDEARLPGDTAVLRSDLGIHVLYFSSREDLATVQARETLTREADANVVTRAKAALPLKVDYSAITLSDRIPGQGLTLEQLIYPDIAHERIPDIPLYLQQDYPTARYGAYPLASWGCGITTLAMVSSYMTDTWLTPPVLAARYGSYCYRTGTDAMLMLDAPPELGYFVQGTAFGWQDVNQALTEGYIAIVLQHKGYFTRGGHFLCLRARNEDGTISIRDSNLYNYGKLPEHLTDHFEWRRIIPAGVQYWILEDKITRTGACHRCGEDGMESPEGLLLTDYTCARCCEALTRRDAFLTLCLEN